MDTGKKVTVTYQMKRGNYAVHGDNSNGDITITITASAGSSSRVISRENSSVDGQGTSNRVCDCNHNNRQKGSQVCEEDRIQGEQVQHQLLQQEFWCNWSVAITMGKTRVVHSQANKRSTQVCASSLFKLVPSLPLPSGKELVLKNESA